MCLVGNDQQRKIEHSIDLIHKAEKRERDRQKLPTAEDYFDWWLLHISLDEYIAKKRQTEINFD